jgi:hypothetical protein
MEALLDITSFLGHLDKFWDNPAWIFAALVGLVGALGLVALMLLYPFSRDTESGEGG